VTSTGQSGWQPDPFGIHEFRYLSSSGAPTKLVRDRGVESYDDPPTSASGTDLTDPAVAPTQDVAGITGTQDVNQRAEPATEAPTRPPASGPPAGWFPDTAKPNQLRYWDGINWTDHTAPTASVPTPSPTAAQLTPTSSEQRSVSRCITDLCRGWSVP
jgi:hypothetical protein